MTRKSYVLTARAAADLREARAWSRARWGKELTNRYFDDLHAGAEFIAQNHASFGDRGELTGDTALHLYPVREHYLVYEPLGPGLIAIVAVIRLGRDVPSILQKWAMPIRRELVDIRERIDRGEITGFSRSVRRPRRKK